MYQRKVVAKEMFIKQAQSNNKETEKKTEDVIQKTKKISNKDPTKKLEM